MRLRNNAVIPSRDQTRTAYRNIDTAINQVKALESAVISAQSALDANEASYEVGIKTSVDVLDSISLLYQQQQKFAIAKYNYILSIIALKQAAGVLEVMDLIQINEWLLEDEEELFQRPLDDLTLNHVRALPFDLLSFYHLINLIKPVINFQHYQLV